VPGLKVVQPSTPHDAKGLLLAAIDDPNPVLIFEHKLLYKTKGPVPAEAYRVPIGTAALRRVGRDLTIVAASVMAIRAVAAANDSPTKASTPKSSICARCGQSTTPPLQERAQDTPAVDRLRRRQDHGDRRGDSAMIAESEVFDFLDAPIVRLGGADTPIPYNPILEKACSPARGRHRALRPARRLVREGGA
jgi:pyruvate dehydrogenase E1 component beta subunit